MFYFILQANTLSFNFIFSSSFSTTTANLFMAIITGNYGQMYSLQISDTSNKTTFTISIPVVYAETCSGRLRTQQAANTF